MSSNNKLEYLLNLEEARRNKRPPEAEKVIEQAVKTTKAEIVKAFQKVDVKAYMKLKTRERA